MHASLISHERTGRPHGRTGMITFEHETLRLCGVPVFSLVIGIVFLAAASGFLFGIARRKQPGGRLALIASASILLLAVVAIALVLLTVMSGSMG